MRNNDLSNTAPPRLIVTLDWFAKEPTGFRITALRFARNWRSAARAWDLDRTLLGLLDTKSRRFDFSVELACIGIDPDEADAIVERLDSGYSNPFRSHETYDSAAFLSASLPHRPEVIGVVSPTVGPYGSWSFDIRSV